MLVGKGLKRRPHLLIHQRGTAGFLDLCAHQLLCKAIKAGRIVDPLKRSESVADKSQRSVLASQSAMGMGCVRVEERVLAAFGGLVQAPTRFEAGRDVSCGGVLWVLPALLANGLLHRQAESFELPKGKHSANLLPL